MERVQTPRRSSPRQPSATRATLLALLLGVLLTLAAGPAVAVPGRTSGVAADSTGPVGATTVETADVANVTVYRTQDVSFEDLGAVEAAIASGRLERAGELVVGDTLVVAIDSPRLAEAMDAGDGSTTERFLDALDGDAEFRLVQTNPTPNAERKVASVGLGNVTAYRNGTTTYALVDTGDLGFRYRSVNRSRRIHGGERFAVRFGHDLGELPRREDPAAQVVTFHPFRAEFDTNGYWYDPLPPEWVRLSVDAAVEPDESLVARVRLEDGRTIATLVEPVDVSGLNEVWLDLRGVEPGTGYTLELVHDGDVVDRYEGTVREPRATFSGARIVQFGGGAAVNVTLSATHGGRIEVLDESCDVLGSKWIEPGIDRRVTIELWNDGDRMQVRPDVLVRIVRHRGVSDTLYRGTTGWTTADYSGGSCPPDDRPSTPTPTPTRSPTASPTLTGSPTETPPETPPSATAPATDSPDDPETTAAPGNGRTTGSDGPGFSVPAALAGLLALTLLSDRRS